VKVTGLEIASKLDPLKVHLKATPAASQLSAAGAVGSLTPRLFLRHALGAEHAAVGTTISGTSSTTTLLNVADASVLKKGTFVAVQVGAEMEWARVDDIDTTTTPDERPESRHKQNIMEIMAAAVSRMALEISSSMFS
jgi:hypothetical protein